MSENENKKIIVIVAIIIVLIAIIGVVLSMGLINSNEVKVSIISTESYAKNTVYVNSDRSQKDGGLTYFYKINGKMYTQSNNDLSGYTAKATFYDEDKEVKTDEASIHNSTEKDTYHVNSAFLSVNLLNIDKVKLEIFDLNGKLVGSEESTFTMGDMTKTKY